MAVSQPEATLIYQDTHLLVVNKPAGLLVIPDGYDPSIPYLVNTLKNSFGALWVVHRLDRETSGVILFARTPEAHRHLNRQFEKHEVRKVYHTLVSGNPSWQEKTVQLPLLPDGDRKHRTVVHPQKGKAAKTSFRVLEHFAEAALIEAIPFSGRRHQIRAHLAAMGFPILGDPLYSHIESRARKTKQAPQPIRAPRADLSHLINRLALHAWQISLEHPALLQRVTYQAGYPEDFRCAIEALRRANPR